MGLEEFLKVSHDNSIHMSLDKHYVWSCLMSRMGNEYIPTMFRKDICNILNVHHSIPFWL